MCRDLYPCAPRIEGGQGPGLVRYWAGNVSGRVDDLGSDVQARELAHKIISVNVEPELCAANTPLDRRIIAIHRFEFDKVGRTQQRLPSQVAVLCRHDPFAVHVAPRDGLAIREFDIIERQLHLQPTTLFPAPLPQAIRMTVRSRIGVQINSRVAGSIGQSPVGASMSGRRPRRTSRPTR